MPRAIGTAAQRSGATVIDLTGALAATRRIHVLDSSAGDYGLLPRPGLNAANPRAAAGAQKSVAYSSPGSGVIIACTLATRAGKIFAIAHRAAAFPPVSERDQAGVDELESQTTNSAFLPPHRAAGIRRASRLQSIGGLRPGMQAHARRSARLDRAGCGGISWRPRAGRPPFSWCKRLSFTDMLLPLMPNLSAPPAREQLQLAFSNLGVRLPRRKIPRQQTSPSPAKAKSILRALSRTPAFAAGVWIWGVADNLRLAVVNAVRIAEELVAEPPVQ